jgi:hypothetical protein
MDELDHLGWVVHQAYEIGAFLVGIRTDSEAFAEWLAEALAEYRTSEAADPYYSVLIPKTDDSRPGKRFHILYRESTALVRTLDLRVLARTLFADLDALLSRDRDDAIYADAALVAAEGVTGLVLPSLTAPYLATLGRRVERVLSLPLGRQVAIDPASGLAVPIRPKLEPNPGAMRRLGAVAPVTNSRHDRLVVERPSAVAVVCSIGLAEEPLRPVSHALTVFRLTQHAVNLPKIGDGAIEGLGRLAERARCYEVRTSNVRDTLSSLMTALRSA